MLTEQRPALARQSLKISVLNYFLAVLVGCAIGSLGVGAHEAVQKTVSMPGTLFGFGFLTAIYLTFSIPHAILGLLPVALLGEMLARTTRLHPIAIAAVIAAASIPVAIWLMPGAGFRSQQVLGIAYGLLVTISWALLSFRTDGLGAFLRVPDRA